MKLDHLLISILFVFGAFFSGCKAVKEVGYDRQLLPGESALRKLDISEIPDFSVACYDSRDLLESVRYSIEYMHKPSSEQFFPMGDFTHKKVLRSLEEFAKLFESGLRPSELNTIIRQKFDVYESVGYDGNGGVLFTGYYTPIFDGSLERTAEYKYPFYKTPDDLVKQADGKILGQKQSDGSFRPYPERRELENSGMLAGKELIWLADPFEVYIAQVQGSAKIRLGGGEMLTVGYDASNGRDYKSVAKMLIADGRVSSAGMSLSVMIDFFKANPGLVDKYVMANPRYVFFLINKSEPRGSLNTPVIPMRSIATDKSIFPRASICFVTSRLPILQNGSVIKRYYTGFAMDQDTGGAIRAPGRCDIYRGQGDKAGELAGQTYQEGKLYYLLLK